MPTTARTLSNDEVRVVNEIWDMLSRLGLPDKPEDLRDMLEDGYGGYKPAHVLRAILRELKEKHRGR